MHSTAKGETEQIIADVRADVTRLILQGESLKSDVRQSKDEAKREMKETLLDLLEVVDALERVFLAIAPKEAAVDRQTRVWLQNFRSVRKLLAHQMEKRGVSPIAAPDGKVRLGFHVIEDTRRVPDLADDTILEEPQRGYLWNGEVLRPARVVCVRNSE